MSRSGKATIPLGVGVYTRAEVSRLLHMHPQRINRWVRGYSYSWTVAGGSRHHGKKPAIVSPDLPSLDGIMVMSFLELIELLIVREFIECEVPFPKIRRAWQHASEMFKTRHPFAHHRAYVGHGSIFIKAPKHGRATDLLELSSRQPTQLVAGPIFERTLQAVDFDRRTWLVRRWWPLGKTVPVVLDPAVAFGAPVVEGTRIETGILAGYARQSGVESVAAAYRIDAEQVRAAVAFENQLARAA